MTSCSWAQTVRNFQSEHAWVWWKWVTRKQPYGEICDDNGRKQVGRTKTEGKLGRARRQWLNWLTKWFACLEPLGRWCYHSSPCIATAIVEVPYSRYASWLSYDTTLKFVAYHLMKLHCILCHHHTWTILSVPSQKQKLLDWAMFYALIDFQCIQRWIILCSMHLECITWAIWLRAACRFCNNPYYFWAGVCHLLSFFQVSGSLYSILSPFQWTPASFWTFIGMLNLIYHSNYGWCLGHPSWHPPLFTSASGLIFAMSLEMNLDPLIWTLVWCP
jgi:hypothetical protein